MVALKEMLEQEPDLSWEVVRFFPRQGDWFVEEYLVVNQLTNHYIELHNGRLEVLEMPTKRHQKLVFWLTSRFQAHCERTGMGEVVMAPYPVKVSDTTYREPDVVVARTEHRDWLQEQFASGADIVVEVLSQDRNRDLVMKRDEYAAAGIGEYWVIDPRDDRVTVLALRNGGYVIHSEAVKTGVVTSAILAGFSIDVAEIAAIE
jgi:Uma2 family endonuclease